MKHAVQRIIKFYKQYKSRFYMMFHFLARNVYVEGRFEFMAIDRPSTHYYEKNSGTSATVGRSVALITVNSSGKWRKRERSVTLTSSDRWSQIERGAMLTSRCNEACMRKIIV